jgi:hypothetical protein
MLKIWLVVVNSHFSHFLRNRLFRTTKTRSFVAHRDLFLKIYSLSYEAEYEFKVLSQIKIMNPKTFAVPRPLKLTKISGLATLAMENIRGQSLEKVVNYVLLSSNKDALRVFYELGEAFRELHNLQLKGLNESNLPSSWRDLKTEIAKKSRRILGHKIELEYINGYESDEIFKTANLHGEAYFTHIMISNGHFIFFDFHKACKGPAFYDLSVFDISLRSSILLSPKSDTKLDLIANALWTGYFGEKIGEWPIRISELYAALSAIEALLHNKVSLTSKAINLLKVRKLRNFIFSIEQELLHSSM